ncbi:MAG TPA: hypothetical protein VNI01_16390 [Elusimicrobiota bacterium]|jgi:hypothetical protein|nr:hypothetical protein [Elusimicrobiota bacterium]
MGNEVSKIISRIAELEAELERELEAKLQEKRRELKYSLDKGRVAFEREACALHARLRQGLLSYLRESSLPGLLVSPLVYALAVPLILLDASVSLFQAVCFPVYGIAKVERSRYILLDRGHLGYLNLIERFNCNYCGYANGVLAFLREVASRTEQYFCPIKHAFRSAGTHSRYHDFADFGDAEGYRQLLARLSERRRKA